jgi:ATP-dependent DNA helicase DinG
MRVSDQKIKELDLLEKFEAIQKAETITALFEGDVTLGTQFLPRIKELSKEAPNFSKEDFLHYLKEGLFFIDAMYAQIYKNNPGIEHRSAQVNGSKLMYISHYFNADMIAEYPTGSGKSFMYLIYAATLSKKVSIVTAGISLQEQLYAKDMPYIASVYKQVTEGGSLAYSLIKGRQNYACNTKLGKLIQMIDSNVQLVAEDPAAMKDYILKIPRHGFNGDLSNIDAPITQEIKEALTVKDARSGGCSSCDQKNVDCHYYRNLKSAAASDVVVINYHVFYTELEKIRTLGFLSGGTPAAYVFDEAHEFAIIGRDFSEESFGPYFTSHIKRQLSYIEERSADVDHSACRNLVFTNAAGLNIRLIVDELKEVVESESQSWRPFMDENKDRFSSDIILHGEQSVSTKQIRGKMATLSISLDSVSELIVDRTGFPSKEALYAYAEENEGSVISEVLAVIESIDDLSAEIMLMAMHCDKFQDPSKRSDSFIYWLSEEVRKDDVLISLKSKRVYLDTFSKIKNFPTESGACIPTVSVSATLAVGSSYKFYRNNMGINPTGVSFEIISASPFDLRKQELWYMPEDAMSGKGATEAYDSFVAKNIIDLLSISKGGALLLFTSKKSMDNVYFAVKRAMPGLRLLKQNDTSRKILLDEFTKDINSVLFANKSFFTGVDVKGPSLRLLVIDKLPFENPTDPVSRTLSGGENGFRTYAIPAMVTTLKQIIGRGIRSVDDKCVIGILDDRLKNSMYASTIRDTFTSSNNHSKRTHSLAEVGIFMNSIFESYGHEAFETSPMDEEDLFGEWGAFQTGIFKKK